VRNLRTIGRVSRHALDFVAPCEWAPKEVKTTLSTMVLISGLFGCSGSPKTMLDVDAGQPPSLCWEGFAPATGSAGCEAILPEGECPRGTMPVLGFTECQPVGIKACSAGFEPLDSGWGCADIAAENCTGVTFAALGQRECLPVGDCSQTWPPSNATHFVDAQGPVDATHFRTIQGAIAAQTEAGAVIAVAPGTYVESMQPVRPMTIVGRCAQDVIVQSPGGNTSGLRVRRVAVTVEGLTLRGHLTGVAIDTQGQVTIRRAPLDANREVGATVAGVGSTLRIEDSVIRDSTSANPAFGRGVQVQAGAQAFVLRTAVVGNRSFGIFTAGTDSAVEVTDSIVANTRLDAQNRYGIGLISTENSAVTVLRSVFKHNHEFNLNLGGKRASVVDSVVRDGIRLASGASGFGLMAQTGAVVSVEGSTFNSNSSTALGAIGVGTQVTVTDTVVVNTTGTAKDTTAVGARLGAALVLRNSALVGNENIAVQLAGGSTTLEHSLLAVTRERTAGPAFDPRAVEASGGCLSMTDSSIVGATSLGILAFEYGLRGEDSANVGGVNGAERCRETRVGYVGTASQSPH
jgi:hypothetical protein